MLQYCLSVCITTIVTLSVSGPAVADPELDWNWELSSQQESFNAQSLAIAAEHSSVQSQDALLDTSLSWAGWTGLFAWHGQDLLSTDHASSPDSQLTVQALFWHSGIELAGIPLDLSVGKMRLDWGVGYGYRPLDLFNPYQRNPIGIQVDEGVGTAILSHFDGVGEWGLVASDASWATQTTSTLGKETQQRGFGLRRYALIGDTEWQGILYYDQIRRGMVAGSLVTVLNDAWEFHSSMAFQNRYRAYNQGSLYQPVQLDTFHHGYQALVGFNWANATGLNIIGEYWYDQRSWSKRDWQRAFRRVGQLSESPVTASLAQSYSNGLTHVNIVEHNLMFHLSLDGTAWHHWAWSNALLQDNLWLEDLKPTLDLLISPTDGGVIATQWLNYQIYDSGESSLAIELAGRFYTGAGNSVYANLPDQHMILLNLKGSF